jgi:membrane peptidoglycan carboxypeptidase
MPRSKRPRRKARRPWYLKVLKVTLAILAVPVLLVVMACIYYAGWALSFDFERVTRMPQTSFVYDRNGYVIQRLYDEHRILIDADDIPVVLKQAILAKEDSRFYYHPGFDPIAIARSVLINILAGDIETGASTITQQLARNSAGMFEKTLDRKLKELFLAIRIEAALSKNEILIHYFNRIYFGSHVHGIGAAADAYFGKSTADLTLSESALLVGIIAAPNAFSPWNNPDKAREVRAYTLERMVDCDFITEEEATAAAAEPLALRPLVDIPGTYIVSVLRDFLPDYIDEEILFRGGLHIHTTIDLAFQQSAVNNLRDGLEAIERNPGYRNTTRTRYLQLKRASSLPPNYLQGAFVAIDNADGGILSLIGGRYYEESRFNRAIEGRRQIGSTVKPFLYAHAFNVLNCTAFTEVDHSTFDLRQASEDTPLVGDNPEWITIRQALQTSDNYAAMRTGLAADVKAFCYFMSTLVESPVRPFPSSLLGACELTPLELASAYTIFPNYGVQLKPYLIRKISTKDDTVLFEHIDERKRVLSPQIAFQIHDLLAGVVDQGTASSLRSRFGIKVPLAGKTGTTNAYKDSWFAGYSNEVTAVLWVGLDQPTTIMPRGYSSRIAVPLWAGIMKPSFEHYPAQPFFPPDGVRKARQKKEEKFLWIFKSTSVDGPPEYVRDDQREGALTRIDDNVEIGPLPDEAKPSLMKRIWNWVWQPDPDDHFEDFGEEEPRAIIHDTSETDAPRAEPVE